MIPTKNSWLVFGLAAIAAGSTLACTPESASSTSTSDTSGSAGTSGGTGPSGGGGAGSSGSSGSAGTSGGTGSSGGGGSSTGADALPAGTFLYVRAETADHDHLIARDFATGAERVVTDLRGDGSEGWEIWGHTLSPDRTRIVVASLYGPTKEDNDTHLATRRLWSLATDGTDFRRLTPVFPNNGEGRTNFEISVDAPMFTADGTGILYDFGNWWYEGTSLQGGSFPWRVPAGGGLPDSFPTVTSCTVIEPSVNPATGEILLIHSVCVNSEDEGIFLYPSTGGTTPEKLVDYGYGAGQMRPSLTTASWVGDGSGFVFVATVDIPANDTTVETSALLAYDMATATISPLVLAEPNTYITSATIAPDATSLVYCLRHDDVTDLHAIDLTQAEPEDRPITTDGKSCYPAF
jgi:hypothetical protein